MRLVCYTFRHTPKTLRKFEFQILEIQILEPEER